MSERYFHITEVNIDDLLKQVNDLVFERIKLVAIIPNHSGAYTAVLEKLL